MNLIKGGLQNFWLSNNFSVKFTRSCASAASPDQSWYASDATVGTYICSNLPVHRWPQSSQHRTEQRCPQLKPTCQNQPHHTHWMRKQPIHIHSTLEHQYCKNVCLDQSITDFICWLLIHSNSFLLSLVPETCTEGRIDRQQKVCYTWPHNQICESTVSYQPLQWF